MLVYDPVRGIPVMLVYDLGGGEDPCDVGV